MLVFNASPLILLFEEINEPQLLMLVKKIDSNLVVPIEVYEEIDSRKAKALLDDCVNNKILTISHSGSKDTVQNLTNRFPTLHSGEISVIAHTYDNPTKYVCIIDDGKAREVAEKLHLPLKGLFGLLLDLYARKEIDMYRLKNICQKINNSSFRIDFKKLGYEWVLK